MKRRDFAKIGVLSAPTRGLAQPGQQRPRVNAVAAVADRLGETHTLGFSKISFQVSPADTEGNLFTMEHSNLAKGGPYRHLHPAQDEWLYAMEGEFRAEIGDHKLTLRSGDSVLMPRKIPHVWTQVSDTPGKLLIAFAPAGHREEFFREFGKGKLPSEPEVVKAYGIERVGPALVL